MATKSVIVAKFALIGAKSGVLVKSMNLSGFCEPCQINTVDLVFSRTMNALKIIQVLNFKS